MGNDILHFEKGNGLLPVIVQDYQSGEVLMLAYMNREAWEKTLSTGQAHYFSRSRNELWIKGATSGHTQTVREVFIDCDGDAVLIKVEQKGGGACHTGYRSCFFQQVGPDGKVTVVGEKAFDPEEVYGR